MPKKKKKATREEISAADAAAIKDRLEQEKALGLTRGKKKTPPKKKKKRNLPSKDV